MKIFKKFNVHPVFTTFHAQYRVIFLERDLNHLGRHDGRVITEKAGDERCLSLLQSLSFIYNQDGHFQYMPVRRSSMYTYDERFYIWS